MGAGRVPPEAWQARALLVAVKVMDCFRARKHRAGPGTVILIGDHEFVCEDRGWRSKRRGG